MTVFDCPYCTYSKTVSESLMGKKIKCPRCLATLTLGVPQPTALTALPLPDEDESPLESKAIELETSETDESIECPVCLKLIDSKENTCIVYKKYLEREKQDGELTDKAILQGYEGLTTEIRKNWQLAFLSLICGIGIILGPWVIWQGVKKQSLLCDNLEVRNRQAINSSILMGVVGILSSLPIIIGAVLYFSIK